jgi:hypothetical protein
VYSPSGTASVLFGTAFLLAYSLVSYARIGRYLYLLFGSDEVLPLDEYVFNTEAHPIRRWYRSPSSPKKK